MKKLLILALGVVALATFTGLTAPQEGKPGGEPAAIPPADKVTLSAAQGCVVIARPGFSGNPNYSYSNFHYVNFEKQVGTNWVPLTPNSAMVTNTQGVVQRTVPWSTKVRVWIPKVNGQKAYSTEFKCTLAQPPGKGLTWRLNSTNATTGTIDVGCGHSSNANECNPQTGDTMCTTQLPILCFKPAQLSVPTNVNNSDQYHKWSGGIVATTPAVAGNSASNPDLTTIANADKYCADLFGPGWRVAEFHDGWGWYFQAYGGLGQPSKRFWVDINGQRSTPSTPKATCWH